jgi:hypothetical protein
MTLVRKTKRYWLILPKCQYQLSKWKDINCMGVFILPTGISRKEVLIGGVSLQNGGGGYNGFALSHRSFSLSVRFHYRVRSINSIPIEGFSTNLAQLFTSTRGCAEPMLPKCQLKVKVTIEGQISNNQILNSKSCPLCKSYTNWNIFFKLGSNVHLNKGMCRTHVANVSAQGQGHNWRSNIKQSNIRLYVVSAL